MHVLSSLQARHECASRPPLVWCGHIGIKLGFSCEKCACEAACKSNDFKTSSCSLHRLLAFTSPTCMCNQDRSQSQLRYTAAAVPATCIEGHHRCTMYLDITALRVCRYEGLKACNLSCGPYAKLGCHLKPCLITILLIPMLHR